MLARSPLPFPRRPVVFIRRRPWQRVVPVVRAMDRRGHPEWDIASRLRISRAYVRRALKAGAGVWSPAEWARMRAAFMEAGR